MTQFLTWLSVALLLAVMVPQTASAQSVQGADNALILGQTPHIAIPLGALQHLVEGPEELSLDEVRARWQGGAFAPATENAFGVDGTVHWIRLELTHTGAAPGVYQLSLNRPFQAVAMAWFEAGGSTRLVLREDRTQPFGERLMPERILVSTPLVLDPGETTTLWVRHAVDGSAVPGWSVLTPFELATRTATQQTFLAVFYAAALITALFLFGFTLVLRTRAQAYYLGFFTFLLLYNAQLDGLLFRFVWPNAPVWNAHASHVIGMTGIIFAALAASAFVDARTLFPLYRRAILAFVAVSLAVIALPLVMPIAIVKVWAGPVTLTFLLLHFVGAYLAIRSRPRGWFLFVLASLALVLYLGAFTLGTQISGLLPPLVVASIIRYGQLVEGALFSASAIVQAIGLRQQAEDNARASRALEANLAATRHDLRQPLLAMRAALHRLEAASGSRDEVESLTRSITFIEALANPARAATAPDAEEPVPTQQLLDGVVSLFEPEAKAAGVTLRAVPSSTHLAADPLLLLRALSNLVSNAIRHSGSDQVLVGALRSGSSMRLLVVDRGHGFDPGAVRPDPATGHGHGLAATRDALGTAGLKLTLHRTAGDLTIAEVAGIPVVPEG